MPAGPVKAEQDYFKTACLLLCGCYKKVVMDTCICSLKAFMSEVLHLSQ